MATTEETGGTAIDKRKPHDVFRDALVARRDEFSAALAGRMDVDHFLEVAQTAYLGNPDLGDPRKCDQLTLFRALRRCAQLKLRPDGEEAAIIPYRKEAQLQVMFKGVVRTLLRTRTVRKIEAHVVRTGDTFEYEMGLTPKLRHIPMVPSTQRGETTHVYAIAWLAGGETQFEVMDRAALDAIEREAERQRGGNSTPAWRNHPDEMRRKIVVKRLAKYLEMDPEQAAVLAYDNAADHGQYREPGDFNPDVETRTHDQRFRDHAARQTEDLRERMNSLGGSAPAAEEEGGVLGELVGFGKHRDMTWGEALESQRGYVTHYVLGGTCPHVPEEVKDQLRAIIADEGGEPEAEVIPDQEEVDAMRGRGAEALVKLRTLRVITDEKMADFGADLGLMAEDGDWHGLVDAVDELERRAAAAADAKKGG